MSSDTPGLRESALRDSNFEIAADLDPPEPSCIGEDGRLTLLRGKVCGSGTLDPANPPREIYIIFRDMAANSSGSSATISQDWSLVGLHGASGRAQPMGNIKLNQIN
ncbi:hypothetical protein BKA61DRAFT_581440 [Leptodontidium sp. MPI-SDFR-AT-0119]|nr:hypothetical protein BKA61DRAFT_581440 [Leptodontidium sp. MPI-SDFR-AT-0119]